LNPENLKAFYDDKKTRLESHLLKSQLNDLSSYEISDPVDENDLKILLFRMMMGKLIVN